MCPGTHERLTPTVVDISQHRWLLRLQATQLPPQLEPLLGLMPPLSQSPGLRSPSPRLLGSPPRLREAQSPLLPALERER